jgi:hypothetical protein
MWQGALVGLVTGAVLGGLAYAIKPPTASFGETMRNASASPPPGAAGAGGVPGAPGPAPSLAPRLRSTISARPSGRPRPGWAVTTPVLLEDGSFR